MYPEFKINRYHEKNKFRINRLTSSLEERRAYGFLLIALIVFVTIIVAIIPATGVSTLNIVLNKSIWWVFANAILSSGTIGTHYHLYSKEHYRIPSWCGIATISGGKIIKVEAAPTEPILVEELDRGNNKRIFSVSKETVLVSVPISLGPKNVLCKFSVVAEVFGSAEETNQYINWPGFRGLSESYIQDLIGGMVITKIDKNYSSFHFDPLKKGQDMSNTMLNKLRGSLEDSGIRVVQVTLVTPGGTVSSMKRK